jgi:hypothetical protein
MKAVGALWPMDDWARVARVTVQNRYSLEDAAGQEFWNEPSLVPLASLGRE